MMKTSKILGTLSLMMICSVALAQGGAPPATPVDGGLSILLAAGGIYGIKKLKDSYVK